MHMKKLLAILVSAALAVSMLAGCGGGQKALIDVLLGLLQGQYTNVTVEADSDLTSVLRQAVSENDTEEDIRKALGDTLKASITFENLAEGQEGDKTFNLVFQPGSDPDTAARNTFTEWNKVFGSLPKGGQYSADLAMIEADNGYYILVNVTVSKAGSGHDDDSKPDQGYTVDGDIYKVTSGDGLKAVADKVNGMSDSSKVKIELENNITLPNNWTPIGTDAAPFKGEVNGNGHTITMGTVKLIKEKVNNGYLDIAYAGLFGYIGNGGKVQSLTIEKAKLNCSIKVSDAMYLCVGAVAGINLGTISDCTVANGSITADGYNVSAGSIAGLNKGVVASGEGSITNGTATNCTVNVSADAIAYAGGLAGDGGSVSGSASGSVKAEGKTKAYAGGLVGAVDKSGSASGTWNSGTITATVKGGNSGGTDLTVSANGCQTYDTHTASAGTQIGYNKETNKPVPEA